MAYSDYMLCAACGCKVLYDAECDYRRGYNYIGEILALCEKCQAKGYALKLTNPDNAIVSDTDVQWRASNCVYDNAE